MQRDCPMKNITIVHFVTDILAIRKETKRVIVDGVTRIKEFDLVYSLQSMITVEFFLFLLTTTRSFALILLLNP